MKIKIITIILIICIFSFMIPLNNTYAKTIGEIFSGADDFLTNGEAVGTVIDENQLQQTSGYLYRTLMAIAIVVMVIVGTIIGIQFMIASADEKAKVKEALIPYIVGCAVVMGAFTIWSVFVEIGQRVSPTSYTIQHDPATHKVTTYTDGLYCEDCHRYIEKWED